MSKDVRSILFYISSKESTSAREFGGLRLDQKLSEVFELVLAIRQNLERVDDSVAVTELSAQFELFDWDGKPLGRTATVGKVPNPGIVIAVQPVISTGGPPSYVLAQMVRMSVQITQLPDQIRIRDAYLLQNRGTLPEGWVAELADAVEINPGIGGFSFDLKRILRRTWRRVFG